MRARILATASDGAGSTVVEFESGRVDEGAGTGRAVVLDGGLAAGSCCTTGRRGVGDGDAVVVVRGCAVVGVATVLGRVCCGTGEEVVVCAKVVEATSAENSSAAGNSSLLIFSNSTLG